MNPIWKERLRRWAPKAYYPAFYLFCLGIFLSWTFPYDKLKERIVTQFNSQQKSATNPQQLENVGRVREKPWRYEDQPE